MNDSDFFRAIGIRPEHIPEPDLPDKSELPGAALPGVCAVLLHIRFEGDEATVSREDLEDVLRTNEALYAGAARWFREAQREHGRAERYWRMSVALMVLCAAAGVWIAW